MEEVVTRTEFIEGIALLNTKLEKIHASGPRFVSRTQIIEEMGRLRYEDGVKKGFLKPLKSEGRNSKVLIERVEYENYILFLKR